MDANNNNIGFKSHQNGWERQPVKEEQNTRVVVLQIVLDVILGSVVIGSLIISIAH